MSIISQILHSASSNEVILGFLQIENVSKQQFCEHSPVPLDSDNEIQWL